MPSRAAISLFFMANSQRITATACCCGGRSLMACQHRCSAIAATASAWVSADGGRDRASSRGRRSPSAPLRRKLLIEEIDAAIVQAHHLQVPGSEFLELVKERLEALEERKKANEEQG